MKKKSNKKGVKSVEVKVAAPAMDMEPSFEESMDSSGLMAAVQSADTLSATTLKNFRHQTEIENFYRFIYENDLRYEALEILNEMLLDKANRKKLRTARAATKTH